MTVIKSTIFGNKCIDAKHFCAKQIHKSFRSEYTDTFAEHEQSLTARELSLEFYTRKPSYR